MQQQIKSILHKKEEFKSAGERKIANFFRRHGIQYIYEHGVFISDEEKTKIWYPDFYLPEYAVYLEYYGLAGNPDYDLGIKKKTEVYASIGIDVVAVFPSTFNSDWEAHILKQISEILTRRMNGIMGNTLLNKCMTRDIKVNQPMNKYSMEDARKFYRSIRGSFS